MKQSLNVNTYQPRWVTTMPKYIVKTMITMISNNDQACKLDEIPQGFGEFGLTITNPIPVYGVPENERYLSNLRLINGGKIRWKRIGSFSVDNISQLIDKYKIISNSGKIITYLYISPYHFKTSLKASKGFKLVNV